MPPLYVTSLPLGTAKLAMFCVRLFCVRQLLYVGHSVKWETPLYGTVTLIPGRFTELLYMGREATKALLHLDKWDRRL